MANDVATPVSASTEPPLFDTDIVPLGERALRRILDHVVAIGDEAETTYLEVKSDIDLGSKLGIAKVVKFLLGAANRRPQDAARHFRGYAVLVIGAKKGKPLASLANELLNPEAECHYCELPIPRTDEAEQGSYSHGYLGFCDEDCESSADLERQLSKDD